MKKSLLSILSLTVILSLSACSNNPTTSTTDSQTSTQDITSENVNTSEINSTNVETSETQETTTQQVDSDPIIEEHSVDISLIGLTVTGKFDATSTQTKFVDWYNTQAGTPGLLTSVVGSKTSEIKPGGEQGEIDYICLGSKSDIGDITFNFSKQIKEIEFVVRPYYKTWSYESNGEKVSGINVDTGCKFQLLAGATSLIIKDLASQAETKPNEQSVSKVLDKATTNFTIKNLPSELSAGRIFVESMKVVW